MAIVTLTEDTSKRATTAIKAGRGIEELLYFPKVPKNLDDDPQGEDNDTGNYVEEVWALQGERFDCFKAEVKKYDEAAQKLTEAREKLANASSEDAITEAQTELEQAQDNMRNTLVKGFGKDNDEVITPLPEGTGKQLIECVGFVNKRLYYISVKDLKKVEDAKGRKTFRFNSDIDKNLFESITEAATDSSEGRTDDKLKTKFWDFQAKINKEWKFGEAHIEGQIKLKRLERYVPNVAVRDFLKATNTCQIIDDTAKFLNDTANFSYQQKEQKRDDIIKLLEKKNEAKGAETPFTHYDWGRVILGVQEIWGKSKPKDDEEDFYKTFMESSEDVPLKEEERAKKIKQLRQAKLPEVTFDASGGAQFMRYSANCGGVVDFNFADGKVSASYGADAKLSVFEAGAEANWYYPSNLGAEFMFKVPVREECYETTVISNEYGESKLDPMFAHNSSFVLPSAIMDTLEQLKGLAFTKANLSPEGMVIQVIGHADTTGSNDYNKKIAYQRAKAVHALFTNDTAQWLEYFQRGFWGNEERDMILLSGFMMENYPTIYNSRFQNMTVGDDDTFEDILLEELREACKNYDYPVSQIKSAKMRQALVNSISGNNDGVSGHGLDGGGSISMPISTNPKTKIDDKKLIDAYQKRIRTYAIEQIGDIDEDTLSLFYIDTEMHPVLSSGEGDLKVQQDGRIAANRRVALRAIGIEKSTQTVQRNINLGDGRLHIQGQVSCFVGATIGLSASVDLNTYKGSAQLVGKKKKDDQVVTYEKKEQKPDPNLAPGNATAKAEAFAGAKAEAALSAALEWNNPEKIAEGFGLLASVGGMVTGTAGAGIEGEFKIGFDQVTNTFQVKLKAQATWGLGCGGAWSFSIGVQQLYDFVVLVYHKLVENDFNFIDIFENEADSSGEATESRINVYEVYLAWVSEMWEQKDYFKAGVSALAGAHAVTAFSLLAKFNDLVREYKENQFHKDKTEHLVNNILAKPHMLKFVPPKVKGRMLFMMVKYKKWSLDVEFSSGGVSVDAYKPTEEAAIHLIETINHMREWKEVMEHLAIKTKDGNFECYDAGKKSKNDILQVQEICAFLRDGLLNDYEDIMRVRKHIARISGLDKAWLKNIK